MKAMEGGNQVRDSPTEPETKGQVLADLVRELRDERELSNDDLAEATAMSVATIGQIMGGTHVPAASSLQSLADALGVSLTQLSAAVDQDKADAETAQANAEAEEAEAEDTEEAEAELVEATAQDEPEVKIDSLERFRALRAANEKQQATDRQERLAQLGADPVIARFREITAGGIR